MRKVRQAVGPDRARAAEGRGAAMGWATAAEYALMLTENLGPPQRTSAPPLDRLSAREKELVTLVAMGRTDAQIAAELFISVRTAPRTWTGSGSGRCGGGSRFCPGYVQVHMRTLMHS